MLGFQSTLPAWGETNYATDTMYAAKISIHSPRMGRDPPLGRRVLPVLRISIHSPRMGRDALGIGVGAVRLFQSTLPAWGETDELGISPRTVQFQSTLPAWGETGKADGQVIDLIISIHSPRMGRDCKHFANSIR